MKRVIIAFDFSCSKPALCISEFGKIRYAVFPADIDDASKKKLEDAGVYVFGRNLPAVSKRRILSDSDIMTEHITRARDLADSIVNYVSNVISEAGISVSECAVVNEGLSFASKGNATLDLSGYKYILLDRLITAGFSSFLTYAPNTVKKTAGCSKRGMDKGDMIEAAGVEGAHLHEFNRILAESPEMLKKKTAFVPCVDDLCDAFWVMRTYIEKEGYCDD